jgi:hypothetical protein
MKTVAYKTFWRYLSKSNGTHHESADTDFVATALLYLNRNPEGELLQEAYSIIEELRMMTNIYNQQLHVAESFSQHLENMHSPPMGLSDTMLEIKNLLSPRLVPHSAEDTLAAQNNPIPKHGKTIYTGHDLPNARSVSESTVTFAKRVSGNIALRRKELLDLQGHAIDVYDEVCRPRFISAGHL